MASPRGISGAGDQRRRQVARHRPVQHAVAAAGQVDGDQGGVLVDRAGEGGGGAGIEQHDVAERHERQVEIAQGAGRQVEHAEPVDAGQAGADHRPAVAGQRVAAGAVRPQRAAELARHRRHRGDLAVAPAVQVPPAVRVVDEVQAAVVVPLRLGDRAAGPAGDDAGRPDAVLAQLGQVQRTAVPGHVGMVPGHPGQPAAVRAGPRIGDEVAAGDQDLAGGIPVRVQGHRDDLVAFLAVGGERGPGMVLAHADQARTPRVRHAVGEPVAGAGQRPRRRAGRGQVQALVREVAVDQARVGGQVGGAAVLVDTGAHVGAVRAELVDAAVGSAHHQHLAAALVGPALAPPQPAVGGPEVAHRHRGAGQARRPERAGPAAPGRLHRLRVAARSAPCGAPRAHRHRHRQRQQRRDPSGPGHILPPRAWQAPADHGTAAATRRQPRPAAATLRYAGPSPHGQQRTAWFPATSSSSTTKPTSAR